MNREREIVEKLKSILEELGVEYSNILLFGSRTGKNFEEESDWDFLTLVDVRVKKIHDLGTILALSSAHRKISSFNALTNSSSLLLHSAAF